MKIIEKETGNVLREVITNHSMTIYEACDLAGLSEMITPDENGECYYDAGTDLEMVY